jgi:hypothetical protein
VFLGILSSPVRVIVGACHQARRTNNGYAFRIGGEQLDENETP